MDTNTILLIVGATIIGIVIGFIISKTLQKNNASKIIKNAKRNAAIIIKDANQDGEAVKKDKIFQAKERFFELKSEHEKVIFSR